MKISETPTNWIIVRADVKSDWDFCNYAIVYIDDKIIQSCLDASEYLSILKEKCDAAVYKFVFWGDATFLSLEEDEYQEIVDKLDNENWLFIETNAEEIEELPKPDQKIDATQLCVGTYKTFNLTGYGEYTGEEFCTESILIDKITEQWQTSVKNTHS